MIEKFRIAIIRKRVRYNTAPDSSVPQWAWKTEEREELQLLDESGVWKPVPVVELPIDDKDEQAETKMRDAPIDDSRKLMRDRIARANEIRQLPGFSEMWVSASPEDFDGFIAANHAEMTSMEAGGVKIYSSDLGRGEVIAKQTRTGFLVIGGKFTDWLDPFSFTFQ